MKQEILYGVHPVTEALRAGRREFVEILLAAQKKTEAGLEALALAEAAGIPIRRIPGARLAALAGSGMHQGIGAAVGPYPLVELDTVLKLRKGSESRRFLLLLDNIVDPHNLGALVRTADCVGMEGILMPKDRSAPPSPAVSKASSGALEHVRLARVSNMVNTIRVLSAEGIWVAGMDRQAPRSLFESDLTGSLAIVIGGEGKGIRPLVKKNCDFLVSIPQSGRVASLNASAAGAVAMYEAYRQRMKSGAAKAGAPAVKF